MLGDEPDSQSILKGVDGIDGCSSTAKLRTPFVDGTCFLSGQISSRKDSPQ